MNKPLIISIEGNIGSGKSTYLKKLSEVWTIVWTNNSCLPIINIIIY